MTLQSKDLLKFFPYFLTELDKACAGNDIRLSQRAMETTGV